MFRSMLEGSELGTGRGSVRIAACAFEGWGAAVILGSCVAALLDAGEFGKQNTT